MSTPESHSQSYTENYGLPAPTRDIEEGRRNLEHYGVTIHEDIISQEVVKELRERLEEQAELEREQGLATFGFERSDKSGDTPVGNHSGQYTGRPIKPPPFQRVSLLVNKGRVFIELAKLSAAAAYVRHAMRDNPFNISNQTGVILRKGAPAQALHIDQEQIPFSTPFPVSITMSIALSEYTVENGATRFVPFSHRIPRSERDFRAEPAETVPLVLKPGSAALWDGRLWHGQGEVSSDAPRYSIATLFTAHFLKMVDCFPASIHDDVYPTLSEEVRALYGFDVVHSFGRIGPRHADDNRRNVGFFQPYTPYLSRQHKPITE